MKPSFETPEDLLEFFRRNGIPDADLTYTTDDQAIIFTGFSVDRQHKLIEYDPDLKKTSYRSAYDVFPIIQGNAAEWVICVREIKVQIPQAHSFFILEADNFSWMTGGFHVSNDPEVDLFTRLGQAL